MSWDILKKIEKGDMVFITSSFSMDKWYIFEEFTPCVHQGKIDRWSCGYCPGYLMIRTDKHNKYYIDEECPGCNGKCRVTEYKSMSFFKSEDFEL